jgi:hypothetical protein
MMASEKAWQLAPEPVQEAKTSTQLSSFLSPEKRREEKRREEKRREEKRREEKRRENLLQRSHMGIAKKEK